MKPFHITDSYNTSDILHLSILSAIHHISASQKYWLGCIFHTLTLYFTGLCFITQFLKSTVSFEAPQKMKKMIYQIWSKSYCPFFNIFAAFFKCTICFWKLYHTWESSYLPAEQLAFSIYAKSSLSYFKWGAQGRSLGCHFS